MAKAIFIHKPDSIYDDDPVSRYDFPRSYLSRVRRTVGDWIVYYEPRSADGGRGRLAYVATARVQDIIPHPAIPDRFFAIIEAGTYLPFDRPVPRVVNGQVIERMLRDASGGPLHGGASNSAVRILSEGEFATIISHAFVDQPREMGTGGDAHVIPGLHDPAQPFEHPDVVERRIVQHLLNRPFREAAFARQVKAAYENRCAMSGLSLRNGGGRPEVEAAHIRPVATGGPDTVRNGLALSATVHWMFDRGLISVADDHTILVSHNKVTKETADRLLIPDRKLISPRDPGNRPHPDYLRYHREHVYGGFGS